MFLYGVRSRLVVLMSSPGLRTFSMGVSAPVCQSRISYVSISVLISMPGVCVRRSGRMEDGKSASKEERHEFRKPTPVRLKRSDCLSTAFERV